MRYFWLKMIGSMQRPRVVAFPLEIKYSKSWTFNQRDARKSLKILLPSSVIIVNRNMSNDNINFRYRNNVIKMLTHSWGVGSLQVFDPECWELCHSCDPHSSRKGKIHKMRWRDSIFSSFSVRFILRSHTTSLLYIHITSFSNIIKNGKNPSISSKSRIVVVIIDNRYQMGVEWVWNVKMHNE